MQIWCRPLLNFVSLRQIVLDALTRKVDANTAGMEELGNETVARAEDVARSISSLSKVFLSLFISSANLNEFLTNLIGFSRISIEIFEEADVNLNEISFVLIRRSM